MEEFFSIGVVSVSIVGGISLGGSVKPLGDESLGDGVLTRGVSEGDTVGSISIGVSSIGISSIGQTIAVSSVEKGGVSLSISRPLAVVTMVSVSVVGDISLGHGVKALGDGVKSRAGTKWNISIGVGVTEASIVSIGISLSGGHGGNTSQNN